MPSCRVESREGTCGEGDERRGMLLKLPLLIRWANFSAARETFKSGLSPRRSRRELRLRTCACSDCNFFSFLLSLDNKGAQRVSVARGCPFVQDAARPRFDPSRHRVPAHGSVLLYRIKLPCRRVHLAFYGLICLAATVTTSRKKRILSSFAKYIHHLLVQSKVTRAFHTLNFHFFRFLSLFFFLF